METLESAWEPRILTRGPRVVTVRVTGVEVAGEEEVLEEEVQEEVGEAKEVLGHCRVYLAGWR